MAVKRLRGKWSVELRLENGARVRKVSPVQTKRGAEAFETELRAMFSGAETGSSTSTQCSPDEVDSEAASAPDRETTLEAFAPEWLETYAVVNNKASEVVSKEMILRVHLLTFFENRTLDSICPRDIERYKAAKLGDELSPKTINNHLTVLRTLLATAKEWGLISEIPVVRRLKTRPPKFDWLNRTESSRLLEAVEQKYPQWRALFWMALRTGLRRGELFSGPRQLGFPTGDNYSSPCSRATQSARTGL